MSSSQPQEGRRSSSSWLASLLPSSWHSRTGVSEDDDNYTLSTKKPEDNGYQRSASSVSSSSSSSESTWATGASSSGASCTAECSNKDLSNRNTSSPATPPAPTCDLYDLIVEMSWHKAIRHLERHPQNARYQDGDTNETCLYVCCQNRPPVKLVASLIRAWPQAAYETSRCHGDLPIHIACRYNASIAVLEALLEHHPTTAVALTSKVGATALQALWEGRDTTTSNHVAENYDSLFWRKIQIVLNAVAKTRGLVYKSTGNNNQNDRLLLVHAAVSLGSLGCPDPVLDYVLTKWPEQVSLRDASTGLLPLHIAVGPFYWSQKNCPRPRMLKPTRNKHPYMIRRLLALYPEAASAAASNAPCSSSVYSSRRVPLHTALAHGHTWHGGGVAELFTAAPMQVLVQDPVTKLYSFQLAAAVNDDAAAGNACSTSDLDTVYRLLRVQPAVLSMSLCVTISSVQPVGNRSNNSNHDDSHGDHYHRHDELDATLATTAEDEKVICKSAGEDVVERVVVAAEDEEEVFEWAREDIFELALQQEENEADADNDDDDCVLCTPTPFPTVAMLSFRSLLQRQQQLAEQVVDDQQDRGGDRVTVSTTNDDNGVGYDYGTAEPSLSASRHSVSSWFLTVLRGSFFGASSTTVEL